MIGSPFLAGRDRYDRTLEGWVDNTHADAFTHTVRIADEEAAVEVRAVCTPSPGYEVLEARATVEARGGPPEEVEGFAAMAGTRMVGGFTRRLAEAVGERAAGRMVVDGGVEIARLARQVAKLPAAVTAGLRPGDPKRCWQLDTTGWVDLPNSCFTYSPAGRALLEERAVTTPMVRDLYTPPLGAQKLFLRKKLVRLVRTGSQLHLFHSMHDNVHGFDIHYEIDLDRGLVVAADSIVSRLPYGGICTEPQPRIDAMRGQPVDAGLRKRLQSLLGGDRGCAQLYDLTADLFKLLTVP
jgi:hypothetical protein